MTRVHRPIGEEVPTPLGRDRSAVDWLRASREAILVAILIAGSVGHILLVQTAGARVPPMGVSMPADRLLPLDLATLDARRVAEGRPAHGSEPAVVAGPDEWGFIDLTGPRPATEPAAIPVPEPPEVVRFRPRNGSTNVDRNAQLSVRFTTSMDHPSGEAAFHVELDEIDLASTVRWAEGDTVLVLRPDEALPYGARVQLRVDAGAMSTAGLELAETTSVSFTVEQRPAATTSRSNSPSGWVWPLIGPITQYFGQTLTKYGFHQGIDIDGDIGDVVRAARSGVVVVAGYADECGGLQVRIDHDGGLLTWYRHLSAIDTTVGSRMSAGTIVGRVGNTGCSLGSHLHFGVSKGGEFVDPLRLLPAR